MQRAQTKAHPVIYYAQEVKMGIGFGMRPDPNQLVTDPLGALKSPTSV